MARQSGAISLFSDFVTVLARFIRMLRLLPRFILPPLLLARLVLAALLLTGLLTGFLLPPDCPAADRDYFAAAVTGVSD